ncbi:MAG: hypothetical protein EOQ86_19675 [Mesorhizobium sp.]|uniref:hypothetical protein n=1 Tax=Mesorhizobium sp. TaxID=1871066 RepID=UPI000FE47B91|nr:hypothetical protein [Mesorhizobium sp.]RWH76850.1 MAG: hypothetical protein EOQ85_20145 [Mesorhizobium sp.]RWH80159.1 MAG: hypothetical protein EOQ86_19675 [Mesorhizobium sp.]RWH88762.1 MAG: hypothetical protein EOQ87_20405 [Mesorhizobium sp.]RWH95619.1 MAG: hypothetical protein EOQ88_22535 [Mesorhizobium sp.]RWI01304.1 MAG: hypothetical protein EOQ89_16745 [Mesorhizobium sp.]
MKANESVIRRVAELQKRHAERAAVTVESIADQLDEDRQLAFSQGQASAAVSASLAKARLFGLLVDKSEVQTIQRKPLREPLQPGENTLMSIEEWTARFAPKPAEPQPAMKEEPDEPDDVGIDDEAIERAIEARRRARSTST